MSTSDYHLWEDIEERFKFFLLLAVLCGGGYLAWSQFIYIVLMLIFGGIAAAYVPLYEISQEKQEELDGLNESQLSELLAEHYKAYRKIEEFFQKNPEIAAKVTGLGDIQQVVSQTLSEAYSLYEYQKQQREAFERSEIERQQSWEVYVQERRRSKGLQHGAPPNSDNTCPVGYPIRATENLKGKKYRYERFRGIYYRPGDPDYNSTTTWCFESEQHAQADNFRESRRRGNR